jgi:CHAD domain-containing protein
MTAAPSTLGDLVGSYLAEQCTVILEAEAPLRSGQNVVHPTRVAVRRLRSTLRVFGDLFDVARAGHLEDELVWWAGLLGEVRDLDVLLEALTAQVAALPPELVLGPVTATLETEVAARRKVGMAAVHAAMDSERYRKLLGLVEAWRSDPPFTEAAQVPATKVKAYVGRAEKKVSKRLAAAVAAHAAGDEHADELFHSARKAGKRHRYAVEAAVPLWGARAERTVLERKELQDLLGAHQDRFVTAAFLRDLGARYGGRSGHNGFTYGLLHARLLADGDTLVTDLQPYL